MDAGHEEFFAIVGEGAALLKNLDEESSGFFDDLNRLREILAMLGYESAVKPLQFSLADKDASIKALKSYLETGIKALPDELALFELVTVSDLGQLIGSGGTMLPEQIWDYQNVLNRKPADPEAKLAAFTTLAGRGVKHGITQEALNKTVADADELLTKHPADDPEYAKARDDYARVIAQRKDALAALKALMESDSANIDELVRQRDAIWQKYDDEQTAAWTRMNDLHQKFYADRAAKHAAIFNETGGAILTKIAEASPITAEQADAWAREQVIDDNAKAKLKRLGYKPDDVVRDMAEFYRLTGGKASAIRIGIDGGKRANAVGITERLGEKVINLGSRFNKTVLFHELAHHLENDPIAKAASNGFLLKRREGEGAYRLRDLTGNKGYDTREVAYKDHFMDAYVGKVYRDGITEVWSMGVQYLANPKDAAIFAAKDPEMFALITGYLTMPLTPAMHAKLNMHKGAIGEKQEQARTEGELYRRAIDYLAGKAPLTKDDWFDTLDQDSLFAEMLYAYPLRKVRTGKAQYVGSSGEYKVFSGVLRKYDTNRNAKGFLLVDASTGGTRSETGARTIPDSISFHGDLDMVRALLAIAHRDNAGLTNAWRYFIDGFSGDPKKKLIETVGVENLQ
jgi:hypothetical protein